MKKFSIVLIILTILFIRSSSKVFATSKADMPYEINLVQLDSIRNRLIIRGWGFISNAQNYRHTHTHEHNLILESNSDKLFIKGSLRNVNQTQMMEYKGSRWCRNSEYFKDATECNNTYEYVGFTFYVPLADLKLNQDYKASLNVVAKTAETSKTIPIYFPLKQRIVLKKDKLEYVIDSRLSDVSLKVLFDYVLVKDAAGPSGKILNSKLNCSSNKTLYFKKHESFYNIFDVITIDNITYYQLGAQEIGCFANYPFIGEGSDIYPVWISSNHVEYSGEQFSIKTRSDNFAPEIKIDNDVMMYVNDEIDFLKGVSANDFEDGDITHKIVIVSNNFKNEAGLYKVVYSVSDSYGYTVSKSRSITVLNKNFPPIIKASDVEIKQFAIYNPYYNVFAYDQDKKDITYRLQALNSVDTSIVSVQAQCFSVTDYYNLSSSKCISVNIVKRNSDFRFISKTLLFYKEEPPLIWSANLDKLQSQLNNEIVYLKRTISK